MYEISALKKIKTKTFLKKIKKSYANGKVHDFKIGRFSILKMLILPKFNPIINSADLFENNQQMIKKCI